MTNFGVDDEFSKVGERMKDTVKTFGLLLPTVGLQRQVVAKNRRRCNNAWCAKAYVPQHDHLRKVL